MSGMGHGRHLLAREFGGMALSAGLGPHELLAGIGCLQGRPDVTSTTLRLRILPGTPRNGAESGITAEQERDTSQDDIERATRLHVTLERAAYPEGGALSPPTSKLLRPPLLQNAPRVLDG